MLLLWFKTHTLNPIITGWLAQGPKQTETLPSTMTFQELRIGLLKPRAKADLILGEIKLFTTKVYCRSRDTKIWVPHPRESIVCRERQGR